MASLNNAPLPDFERVTSSATIIVDEFRKLPNVTYFNSAQVQAQMMTALNGLTASIQRLEQTVVGLRNDINTLQANVNTDINTLRTDLTAQISTLRVDMNNGFGLSEINSRARVHNKGAVNRAADLHPLATQYGANGPNFPANFPTTLHDVYSLRGTEVDALLASYNLPGNGSLPDKKRRFGEHIGVELHV